MARITLRRKEDKLKWAMKEHEQQVYEEKVRFLINISHELRTPLTLIHAPLSRLLKRLSPADTNYPPLKSIFRQSQQMKDLLNFAADAFLLPPSAATESIGEKKDKRAGKFAELPQPTGCYLNTTIKMKPYG